MGKRERFLKRVAFAFSTARTVEWIAGGGVGALAGSVTGVLTAMSVTQLAFSAVGAFGAFVIVGAATVARLAWRHPNVRVEVPQHSDISITRYDAPFPGGLLATQAMTATGGVTTPAGQTVSKPAVMVLVPVSNEYATSRDSARNLTVHLSCWTENGEELTRVVRARQRGAPVNEPPLELAATSAPVLFDSVCKIVEDGDAYIYTDEGVTDDFRVDVRTFVLRIAVRGEFREIAARYRVTHAGPGTRLQAVLLGEAGL